VRDGANRWESDADDSALVKTSAQQWKSIANKLMPVPPERLSTWHKTAGVSFSVGSGCKGRLGCDRLRLMGEVWVGFDYCDRMERVVVFLA
jgi:hypothetical protein